MPKVISVSRWRPLYELAQQLYDLAPWDDMVENEIFAVQDPATGKTGYISIMGNIGQHFALSVYLDKEGLFGFLKLQALEGQIRPIDLLLVPQLQLSFEERDYVENEDEEICRALDFKSRNRHAWPVFRSYLPGHAPWFLDNDEIAFFRTMLEQALIVLSDEKTKVDLITRLESGKIITRIAKASKTGPIWGKAIKPLNPYKSKTQASRFELETSQLTAAQALPKRRKTVYVDVQLVVQPVMEKGSERPFFPHILLFMEKATELVLHMDVFTGKGGWPYLHENLPAIFLNGINTLEFRPARIAIRSKDLYDILKPMAQLLEFKLELLEDIPCIDAVMDLIEKQGGRPENVVPMPPRKN